MPARKYRLSLCVDIITNYVAHNALPSAALPELIQSVYDALEPEKNESPASDRPRPAVHPRQSVFRDYLVCLEDGKSFRLLKRHLSINYGLTPDEYRARWGLPAHYPMVAPSYAAYRTKLAKQTGLGQKRHATVVRLSPNVRRKSDSHPVKLFKPPQPLRDARREE